MFRRSWRWCGAGASSAHALHRGENLRGRWWSLKHLLMNPVQLGQVPLEPGAGLSHAAGQTLQPRGPLLPPVLVANRLLREGARHREGTAEFRPCPDGTAQKWLACLLVPRSVSTCDHPGAASLSVQPAVACLWPSSCPSMAEGPSPPKLHHTLCQPALDASSPASLGAHTLDLSVALAPSRLFQLHLLRPALHINRERTPVSPLSGLLSERRQVPPCSGPPANFQVCKRKAYLHWNLVAPLLVPSQACPPSLLHGPWGWGLPLGALGIHLFLRPRVPLPPGPLGPFLSILPPHSAPIIPLIPARLCSLRPPHLSSASSWTFPSGGPTAFSSSIPLPGPPGPFSPLTRAAGSQSVYLRIYQSWWLGHPTSPRICPIRPCRDPFARPPVQTESPQASSIPRGPLQALMAPSAQEQLTAQPSTTRASRGGEKRGRRAVLTEAGCGPRRPVPRRWDHGGLRCVALSSAIPLPDRGLAAQGARWAASPVGVGVRGGRAAGTGIPRARPPGSSRPHNRGTSAKFAPSLRAAAWGRGPRGGAAARPEGGVWRAGRALPPGRPRLARDQGADVEFPARLGAPPAAPRPAAHSASGRSPCGRTRVRACPAPHGGRRAPGGRAGAAPASRGPAAAAATLAAARPRGAPGAEPSRPQRVPGARVGARPGGGRGRGRGRPGPPRAERAGPLGRPRRRRFRCRPGLGAGPRRCIRGYPARDVGRGEDRAVGTGGVTPGVGDLTPRNRAPWVLREGRGEKPGKGIPSGRNGMCKACGHYCGARPEGRWSGAPGRWAPRRF